MKIKSVNEVGKEFIQRIIENQKRDIEKKEKKAKEVLDEIKERGDEALCDFTEKFDDVSLEPSELKVTQQEVEEAYEKVEQDYILALEKAAENIAIFHSNSLPEDLELSTYGEGIRLGQKFTAIESVGCYVPGGKASYPSSVLMTVIPANIAGVKEITVTSPPNKKGKIDPHTLVACDLVGTDEIYKIGGIQAIAAMALGTKTISKKQKIVGPGGPYVAAAKNLVKKKTDIDMVAGPSEIAIIADESADEESITWDMFSQAEHGPDSISVLFTTKKQKAKKIKTKLINEIDNLDRKKLVKKSLDRSFIVFGEKEKLFELSNELAPEHLEIITKSPLEDLDKVKNAGAIFLGKYSPVSIGDYATGCNHVLPTAGLAKTSSGLGVDDFMKKSSVQYLNKKGLSNLREIAEKIADVENMSSHKEAISTRFREDRQND